MKTWWIKFRISNTLAARKPFAPAVQRALEQSKELRQFTENYARMEAGLKEHLPMVEPPASLHADIIRAVQTAQPRGPERFQWLSWRPISALGVVVIVGFILTPYLTQNTRQVLPEIETALLPAASSTMGFGDDLVRDLPTSALTPMTDELTRLNHDWTEVKKFLIASLP